MTAAEPVDTIEPAPARASCPSVGSCSAAAGKLPASAGRRPLGIGHRADDARPGERPESAPSVAAATVNPVPRPAKISPPSVTAIAPT